MKKLLQIIILGVLLAACNGKKAASISDFSNQLYTPEYASGFSIRGADGSESSIITVTNPWQGADSITTQLFIARGGESTPEGFTGQVLEGDASRIVAMSSLGRDGGLCRAYNGYHERRRMPAYYDRTGFGAGHACNAA